MGWDAASALTPMGARSQTHDNIDALVQAIKAQTLAGDVIVCMSNGGFGGIHGKLALALQGA